MHYFIMSRVPGRGTAHSTEDLFLSCQTTTPYCVPLCALCVRVNSKVEHAVPLPGTLIMSPTTNRAKYVSMGMGVLTGLQCTCILDIHS